MTAHSNKAPNALINESSPYLLQHAYNPVQWVAFGPEAFETARREKKTLLISIGYSACHWCHVMEHECFEDAEVAALMNAHFINVKVDREERSDVDMLYMQAVQLMTGRGGWPLNCFVLPDGRPFYGGTYFPKQQWLNVLKNLARICSEEREKVEAYANELTDGIKKAELITTQNRSNNTLTEEALRIAVDKWKARLDSTYGGPNRAPKFPMPSNYRFLLRYATLANDSALSDHVNLTLTQMAFGGIYDQLYGGFARYSTDVMWKVPHFEKMLYDNAQLVALYSEAYLLTGNPLYKQIAVETLAFVKNEWYNPGGYFYSAYDADSDGEEGKYYVWTKEDLRDLLGEEFELFCRYFEINDTGYWEHGNYILMRAHNTAALLAESGMDRATLEQRIENCKVRLRQEAKSRLKPGLDDKTITSWNALMCSALAQAYLAFGDEDYRRMALETAGFINARLLRADGGLFHAYKNGVAKIDAFLDDYVFVAEAWINCYLISQNEAFLHKATALTEYVLTEFENKDSHLFYYTGKSSEQLVTRTTETSDNVIPASNSQLALNLFYLGTYLNRSNWKEKAEQMLRMVLPEMQEYGAGYSNWACLALHLVFPFREVAIVGNNVDEKLRALWQHGLTNTIFAVSATGSELPLLINRMVNEQTTIYVCENNACKLPVTTVEAALEQLE